MPLTDLSGIGAGMEPYRFLEDGEIVTIEVENIGQIRNKMIFEK